MVDSYPKIMGVQSRFFNQKLKTCQPYQAVIGIPLYPLSTGESRWESPVGQTPAPFDSRQRRLANSIGQLHQGSEPRPGHHPRGAAPPAAAGEHLAAPQTPPAPAPAALRLPTRCPTGTPSSNQPLRQINWADCSSLLFGAHALILIEICSDMIG